MFEKNECSKKVNVRKKWMFEKSECSKKMNVRSLIGHFSIPNYVLKTKLSKNCFKEYGFKARSASSEGVFSQWFYP